jgi:hypothetical protein
VQLEDPYVEVIARPTTKAAEPPPAPGVPLEVRFVDAVTGSRVVGVDAEASSTVEHASGVVYGVGHRWTTCDLGALRVARDRDFTMTIRPLSSSRFGGCAVRGGGRLSRRAASARIDVPLYRAVELRLRVTDESGQPVSGAMLNPSLGGAPWCSFTYETSDSDAAGIGVVSGLPALPLNTVRVHAWKAVPGASPGLDGTPVLQANSPLFRLDAMPAEPVELVLRPAARISGVGGRGSFSCGSGCDRPARPSTVTVRVLRRDGTPAEGVHASAGGRRVLTGADGTARIEVRPGSVAVAAFADDFVAEAATIDADGDCEVVLREQEPRRVTVRVEDPAGGGVPGALVRPRAETVRGRDGTVASIQQDLACIEDGCQVLTAITDPSGCRTFEAPPGRIRISAVVGAVGGAAESDADDFTLVLRPAGGSE